MTVASHLIQIHMSLGSFEADSDSEMESSSSYPRSGCRSRRSLQRRRDIATKFRALDQTWLPWDLDISIRYFHSYAAKLPFVSCSADWDVVERECTCRVTWKLWLTRFGLCLYYQDYAAFRVLWIKKGLHVPGPIPGPIEVDTLMRAIGWYVFVDPPEAYWRSLCPNRG